MIYIPHLYIVVLHCIVQGKRIRFDLIGGYVVQPDVAIVILHYIYIYLYYVFNVMMIY